MSTTKKQVLNEGCCIDVSVQFQVKMQITGKPLSVNKYLHDFALIK